jgi:hypothetical protein
MNLLNHTNIKTPRKNVACGIQFFGCTCQNVKLSKKIAYLYVYWWSFKDGFIFKLKWKGWPKFVLNFFKHKKLILHKIDLRI